MENCALAIGNIDGRSSDSAIAVADGVNNGLNTLMDIKIDDKDVISDPKARALFIQRLGVSDGLKELRVVRGKGTDDEFGEGLPQENPVDDMDRSVLASGKTEFKMTVEANGDASLRAVLPSIARKEYRQSKCLECHGVDEGTVLGVVSVTLDIKEDHAKIGRIHALMWMGQVVLQIVLFFAIGLIVRRSLRELGAEPAEAAKLAQSVATRAGEQGRGFAVVATEVRSLAGRSGRQHDERGGRQHTSRHRHHGRDQRVQYRAKYRRVTSGSGRCADGRCDAAKCRVGGRNGRGRRESQVSGAGVGGDRGGFQVELIAVR